MDELAGIRERSAGSNVYDLMWYRHDTAYLIAALDIAEQQVQEERHKSLGMANEINLAVESYKEMEQNAAETKTQLDECKGLLKAVVEEVEWVYQDGIHVCPWCNYTAAAHSISPGCSHKSAEQWLEFHRILGIE